MKKNLFQTIDVKTIPAKGISFDLQATSEECDKLTERFKLPAVKSFSVFGSVKGHDILCFSGQFTAQITQQDVATLENFDATVSGEFKEYFSEKGTDFSTETNFDIDMEDEETVDLIQNGRLDIGEIAAQQFGLNLDPFPKQNNEFHDYIEVSEKPNPFAVLKSLIKK